MALELKTAKQIRKYVESELAGISDEHPDLRIEAESEIERESDNIWWRLIGEEGPGLEDKDYTIEPCPERDEFLIWFGTRHVWGAFIGDEFTGTDEPRFPRAVHVPFPGKWPRKGAGLMIESYSLGNAIKMMLDDLDTYPMNYTHYT
jgi:hypothetical protein